MEEVLFLVCALIIFGALWLLQLRLTSSKEKRARREAGALPAVSSDENYRLARDMARILDRQLNDDMVAVVIPSSMRKDMETVLDEFYGDYSPKPLPRPTNR